MLAWHACLTCFPDSGGGIELKIVVQEANMTGLEFFWAAPFDFGTSVEVLLLMRFTVDLLKPSCLATEQIDSPLWR